MHCVRKVYFRWKKEREREELLALVQCRFEVFSGQYLISTNKTNKITAKFFEFLFRENVTIFSILTRVISRGRLKDPLKNFSISQNLRYLNFDKLSILILNWD